MSIFLVCQAIYKEMEATLKILNNEKAIKIYEEWKNINEKREIEMIKNIYSYCKNNKFDKGIFFIGAAHRESVINKIKKNKTTERLNINWSYLEFDNNNAQIIPIE